MGVIVENEGLEVVVGTKDVEGIVVNKAVVGIREPDIGDIVGTRDGVLIAKGIVGLEEIVGISDCALQLKRSSAKNKRMYLNKEGILISHISQFQLLRFFFCN